MIIYRDMNDEINVFDSGLFDGQRDGDPLLEIAVDIVVAGKKRNVNVGDIQSRTVASWNRCRKSKERILHPNTVLHEHWNDANRKR